MAYSSTWTKHVITPRTIFDRLCAASLTLNLAKCEFGKAVVTYLGKQVWQGQVCPVRVKVQAIIDFPVPQMRREIRQFLGMAGYYRAFCKNFSEVVAPLTSLASPKNTVQVVREMSSGNRGHQSSPLQRSGAGRSELCASL